MSLFILLFYPKDEEKQKLTEQITKQAGQEELVDFVIESRSPRKSIDLPDRSEGSHTSPSKTPPMSASSGSCAPGKLKMRWLQASKQQQENIEPTTIQVSSFKSHHIDLLFLLACFVVNI